MHLTDHLHEYLEQTQVSVTHLLPGQCTRALILTIRDVINKSAQQDHMLSFVGIDPHGLAKISQTLLISFEEREARLQKPTITSVPSPKPACSGAKPFLPHAFQQKP